MMSGCWRFFGRAMPECREQGVRIEVFGMVGKQVNRVKGDGWRGMNCGWWVVVCVGVL